MFQKYVLAGVALVSLSAPQLASADHPYERDAYIDARVVRVEPIYRYVTVHEPRRECWVETAYYEDHNRSYRGRSGHNAAGAMIAGGIIGGVIGHQFGSGRGQDAATVAGVLIGSSLGHDAASDNRGHHYSHSGYDHGRSVRRCETRDSHYREREIDGYRVTYAYQGRHYTTRMPYDPGRTVTVRVSVTPVGG